MGETVIISTSTERKQVGRLKDKTMVKVTNGKVGR
jgi:hypothetical protein